MNIAPVVYDVGLHNGDDSDYYLTKGFRVVGIEADVSQCDGCRRRFARQIATGDMTVLNVGVGSEEGVAEFFVHRDKPALSTFVAPERARDEWLSRNVTVRRLSSIVREYGEAYFIKIDVERYDHIVLLDLLTHGLRPKFVSAESHVIDVFCALVCMGYERFKIVDGARVAELFGNHAIETLVEGRVKHRFSGQSSGPFGEDLPGQWIGKDGCLEQLLRHGLGWVDIHGKL
jgi:FkbM family methyltransferase